MDADAFENRRDNKAAQNHFLLVKDFHSNVPLFKKPIESNQLRYIPLCSLLISHRNGWL